MTTAVLFGSYMPPPANPRFGVTATWTGWDGSEWDLTDYQGKRLALTRDGLAGLLWPEFNAQVTTSPAMHGQRLTGVAALPRLVEFPVLINGATSNDFLDLFTRFTRSWSPLKTGVLSITSGTTTRSIRLRIAPSTAVVEADPVHRGQLIVTISAIADDPFWLSEVVEGDWSGDGEIRDFFSDAPGSYLFWISPSRTFADATITNPGDVDAFPVWEVTADTGTLDGTITVNGGTIGLPVIPAGKTLIIDTDPATGYADLGTRDSSGVFTMQSEADGILDPYEPRPIPPGRNVPIGFDLTGSGSVTARFRARYWLGIGNG